MLVFQDICLILTIQIHCILDIHKNSLEIALKKKQDNIFFSLKSTSEKKNTHKEMHMDKHDLRGNNSCHMVQNQSVILFQFCVTVNATQMI